MKKIILDTNFILIPFSEKVDIFSEIDRIVEDSYKLFILDKTKEELESIIKNQRGKDRDAARFAKKYIPKLSVIETDSELDVDSLLVALAEEEGTIIATQDKDLKRKIKKLGKKVMVLRQKSHLAIR